MIAHASAVSSAGSAAADGCSPGVLRTLWLIYQGVSRGQGHATGLRGQEVAAGLGVLARSRQHCDHPAVPGSHFQPTQRQPALWRQLCHCLIPRHTRSFPKSRFPRVQGRVGVSAMLGAGPAVPSLSWPRGCPLAPCAGGKPSSSP